MPEWPATQDSQVLHLTEQLSAASNHIEILEESLYDLELAAEDRGWQRLGFQLEHEFSRTGITTVARNCRVMAIASPLIKRGLQLRIGYVWGQGVQVQARDEDVNEVIKDFWDDESNQAAFTSSQAQEENERALGTDGNLVLAFFTNPLTGRVQVRTTPFEEILDVICNPDDRDEPWFYAREYEATVIRPFVSTTGIRTTRSRLQRTKVLHPALGYRPLVRPKEIDGISINWDAPMLHVAVNRLDGWKWGIPDAYAALPWARAYDGFLTDWAKLVKALSRFAWRLTGDKGSKARRAAETLGAIVPPVGQSYSEAGALAAYGPGAHLEAIPKSGATIDSESGRPLAAMVAAAMGVSVVSLLADPGTTGNRATAETLDKPTVLEAEMRRSLWGSVISTVTSYVIDQAVKAPRGPLQGTVVWDRDTGREVITLANDAERTVDIDWPELTEESVKELVDAIVAADGTGKVPPLTVARLLLLALDVEDVDEILEDMVDDEGNWIDPDLTAAEVAVREAERLLAAGG